MTNLKKGLFELHIIGDPSKKKVLLHNIPRTTRFMFCVIRPVIHILIMKMVR